MKHSLRAFLKKLITTTAAAAMLLFMFGTEISYGQVNESFTNITEDSGTSSQYLTRSWTGDDGGTWGATDARTDQTINGPAIFIRDGELTSPSISGGIGSLTLTTQRKFAGGSGDLTVKVNGATVGTIAYDETVQTNSINDINIDGDIQVVIETPGNGDRIAMDDLIWTAYSPGSPTLTPSTFSLSEMTYIDGGGPSASETFTFEGSDLDPEDATITIGAPTNFEVSLDDNSFGSTQTVDAIDGEVTETTVYARLIVGLNPGDYSGNITLSGGDATQQNISVTGRVLEPFEIPYSNGFRDQDDFDNAIADGFTISNANQETSAGGYLRISLNGYAETPTIDFTEFDYIETKFDIEPWGTGSNREFSVLLSNDDGESFDIIATYSVPGSYETFKTLLDLTDDYNVTDGRIQFKMTAGTGRTRFRDLEINEAFATKLTGTEGFRMLSTPVEVNLEDFLAPIWTQGATGSDFSGGDPNVFVWDTGSDEWSGVTDLTTTNVTPGTGILVYVFDKDDHDDEGSNIWPKTISVIGAENAADASPDVNQAENGFTLLGNPFSVTIDFNDLDKTDLKSAVYVWDTNDGSGQGGTDGNDPGGSWKTYSIGSGGDLTDGLIAPFQGFFVESDADDTPEVTFPEGAKTTGGEFLGKQNEEERMIVRLEMSGENMRNSAWLSFSETGSLEGQVRGDALKLEPLSSNFALLATKKVDGTLFDISHLPVMEDEYSVPVHISATKNGSYTLTATDMELPSGFELYFHDHTAGASVQIDQNFEYTVEVASAAKANEQLSALERVKQGPVVAKATEEALYSISVVNTQGVNIDEPGTRPERVALNQNYPNPFNPVTVISYELPVNGEVTLDVFDMTGRKVATLVNGQMNAGSHNVTFDASSLSSGVYIYRLQTQGMTLTRKLTLIK